MSSSRASAPREQSGRMREGREERRGAGKVDVVRGLGWSLSDGWGGAVGTEEMEVGNLSNVGEIAGPVAWPFFRRNSGLTARRRSSFLSSFFL